MFLAGFGALKFRAEEFELAFDGHEWKAAGVGEGPAVGALEPFRAVVLDAIGDFSDADDAAGFIEVRKIGDAVFALDGGEGFGRGVGFALARVDENEAAQVGRPNPVFNVFVAVDDEPGPRLADGYGFQLS